MDKIPFSTIFSAYVDKISGMTNKEISEKYSISQPSITRRIEILTKFMNDNTPALSKEREIISQALSENMKPIKEEIAVKALEIIKKADDLVSEKLTTEGPSLELKDIVKTADSYSSRFARLTGVEDFPALGKDTAQERTKIVNTYVQNIFNNHDESLDKDREKINNPIESTAEILDS